MIDNDKLKIIFKKNSELKTYNWNKFACKEEDAFRFKKEESDFMRSAFAVDRDRILYSGAYRRYHGKTQVFSFTNLFDEEMTNRNLHTTYVSQISRTIGKALGLNLELIEAIALGHDLGHSPFGHDGEVALSENCVKNGIDQFHHNIESLHIVDNISHQGEGLNLTFQVRDGIISHDGEVHNTQLKPDLNKTENDIKNYIDHKKNGEKFTWMPATMEGCVVRISDTIAYIGQDIEDAIRSKILKRDEIPKKCTKYLGNRNSLIIDTLVRSAIVNSYDQEYVAFDEETSHYLFELKKFNYQHIYTNKDVKKIKKIIFRSMKFLFQQYLDELTAKNKDSKIFTQFLDNKCDRYLQNHNDAEKVRDFIATMTDRYFNEEVKNYLLPGRFL
ncbi:MAG: HD domain-containing protein [Candidatus Cloacimonetes bacterium]|nr:HD domain-containing protein [Candidatus Cloacimonadota bacterium]